MAKSGKKFGLIVVSAPSGAGKSTLCNRLLQDLHSRLAHSVSSTSRAPRGQEQNGKEYYFNTAEEFKKLIDTDQFAEWALVHGNYYGTSKKILAQLWGNHKHVLLDIDVQGAASLRAAYPDRCFCIFLTPPNMQELEKRLRQRGTDSEEVIQSRMKNAIEEIKRKDEFEMVIVNDQLEVAYQKLLAAVTQKMDSWENPR